MSTDDERAMFAASEKLWEEALRLADLVNGVNEELLSRGLDVIKLLSSVEAASANPRTRGIIKGAREKNSLYIKRGGSLSDIYKELLQEHGREIDFYIVHWQEVLKRNRRVDPEKIANEELLGLITQARQTMESAPAAAQVLVALAAIANYSQYLYYVDLLNALLQYPTKYRRTLDLAGVLAKAAVMDLAGTAIPFLGTLTTVIDTIFDLAEPRIDKKVEELRKATEDYDRVCDFDDQLIELLKYADFAEENMGFADRTLKATHVSFAREAAWLSAVLGNAERT
jgi:hypothetical protein